MFHDRIDNLEYCNHGHFQQLTVTENAVDVALQRIRLTEEPTRNIQGPMQRPASRFHAVEAADQP